MAYKPENVQKYENYKEQFKRLNKAMNNQFYLEAIFISYAIIEDRTESILHHAGKWDAYLKRRGRYQVTLDSKINYISNFAREKKSLLNKYFGDGILDEILEWKEKRNKLMHALMKQSLTTEILESLAIQGKEYARVLTNKSGSYRRAIERAQRRTKV